MTVPRPFAEPPYALSVCSLRPVQSEAEASALGALLAAMAPWRTLGYTATALQRYLWRQDATLYRYAVVVQDRPIGVVCVRYPWLRGAYLELIGLEATVQRRGIGREIVHWLEGQARLAAHNVWVLVSAFNAPARTFYARQGFAEIGTLKDFVRPGADEVLLRKVVR